MKVRYPAVAGSWYPDTSRGLREQVEWCFTHKFGPGKLPKVAKKGPRKIVGLISPHAGYVYSGPVAAHGFFALAADGKPDVVVLLGPNHTGLGSGVAIVAEGVWRTPLGDVSIDVEAANRIVGKSSIVDVDDRAHAQEHSIELQLPFLQYLYGAAFKMVPIAFLMQDLETGREVGRAVASALAGKNAVVVATTDLTHYEPQKSAERKDKLVIDAVLKLDEARLYSTVESLRVSMCGYGPVVAVITAAKLLGAEKAEVLCYKTSGDITGDYSAVVGYTTTKLTK